MIFKEVKVNVLNSGDSYCLVCSHNECSHKQPETMVEPPEKCPLCLLKRKKNEYQQELNTLLHSKNVI